MARKDWNKVAQREFETMDKDWQDDWSDLRERVNNA